MEREGAERGQSKSRLQVVATCWAPKKEAQKWTHTIFTQRKTEWKRSRDLVGAGKSRDFAALSAAAAAYFNQCTTTMIFIFMRQRNDLVSTYLNLHFNCLAHFMSHSSSRAKSADARARALRSALHRKKAPRERETSVTMSASERGRVSERERECVRVGVEFLQWSQYTN